MAVVGIGKRLKITVGIIILFTVVFLNANDCQLETEMIEAGLVNILEIDSNIKVEIFNASENNILGINTYGCMESCFLQPEVAEKLLKAQNILKKKHPDYNLKALECTRPRRVQVQMFDVVKNTAIEKFVADPSKGSMHNYGAAVDVTIVDENGIELKMGQPDPRMQIKGKNLLWLRLVMYLNKPGKVELENRELLRTIMVKAGFTPISYEWWHFDAFDKEYTRKKYQIIE